jgi:hypothetical protein
VTSTVRAAGLAAALAALAGCPLHPRAPRPTTLEGAWNDARTAASRRALLYDGIVHRATATATHLSLTVREARARRLGEWLGWTPQELEERLARERAEAELGEEFVVSFYAADRRADDLDAPRSVWRVAVKVANEDILPTRVTSIDGDATTAGLFPYVGPFDTVYRVVLPRSPSGPLEGRPFALEIASALGTLSLDFGAKDGRRTTEPWQAVPPP